MYKNSANVFNEIQESDDTTEHYLKGWIQFGAFK